ncbi:hypothetical protein PFISCL1PPCAC_12060, partial [Pristionchus fissidentatus]
RSRYAIAASIHHRKSVVDKLTRSQKKVVYNQIGCEAREQTHIEMWKIGRNKTTTARSREYFLGGRQCNNLTTTESANSFVQCMCNESMYPTYCKILQVYDATTPLRSLSAPNCSDDAWARLNATAPVITWRLQKSTIENIDAFGDLTANTTRSDNVAFRASGPNDPY